MPCRLVNQQRFCSHPPTHTNERPTSAGRRTPFHFHACHSTQQAHATPPPRRLCRRGGPAVPAYASAVKICVMAGLERGPGRQGPAAVTRQKAREMLAASSSRRIRDPEILRASMTTCVLRVFAPSIYSILYELGPLLRPPRKQHQHVGMWKWQCFRVPTLAVRPRATVQEYPHVRHPRCRAVMGT